MSYQITRRLRLRVHSEIRGRANDGRTLIGGHSHGNHVALDELTKVNARVEVPGDKIEAHFLASDKLTVFFEKWNTSVAW